MQILNKTYTLSASSNISADILRAHIKSFWYDVFTPLHAKGADIHLMLMCKIGYDENNNTEYKTIADLRRVNFDDKEVFTQYLLDRLGILSDSYNIKTCTTVTFTYIIALGNKDGLADDTRKLLNQTEYTVTNHNYNNIKY